jgi:DHA2 family methylenomycin A resistance protein-like MFS transporter
MTAVGLVTLGFGVSFAIPSLITAVVAAAATQQAGIGAGALNSARQTGAVLGVAVLGSIIAGSRTTATGTAVSLCVCAVLLLLGAAIAAVFLPEARGS